MRSELSWKSTTCQAANQYRSSARHKTHLDPSYTHKQHTSMRRLEWRVTERTKYKKGHAQSCLLSSTLFASLCVSVCAFCLPQNPPSMTVKLGRSQRNKRGKDQRKGQRGKWDVGGWIGQDRWRQTWGKRPTCADGEHQDIKVERKRHGEKKRLEGEGDSWKRKQQKIRLLWNRLHIDEILIYNGASILNPPGVERVHRNFRIMQHVEIFPELFEILNSLLTRWGMA